MSSKREERAELLRLALPLILAQLGGQLLSTVDALMVGRLGAGALGGVGIGNMLYLLLTCVGMGCLMGMDPLISQAVGAGDEVLARRILWQGLRLAAVVGVASTLVLVTFPFVLPAFGVSPATADATRLFLWGRSADPIALSLMVALRVYLVSHGITRPVIVVMVVMNVVNIIGDALLIFGDRALVAIGLGPIGLPALGPLGCGLSTSFAVVAATVVFALAVRKTPTPHDPQRRTSDPELRRRIVRLGIPIGLQVLAELGLFTIVSVLAGLMGDLAAAGHHVAMTLMTVPLRVSLGLASATAVLVGRRVGGGKTNAAREIGLGGLRVAVPVMALGAAVFFVFPEPLARVFTSDPHILETAVPLVMLAGLLQFAEGADNALGSALRGAGDTRYTFVAHMGGYYLVGLPLALVLGFGCHMGPAGLWWGLVVGIGVVSLALLRRFVHVTSRDAD